MKYYHLIGFSIMLTVLQFVLQSVFYWEVPLIIQKIFLGLQSTLLVGYSLLFLIFLVKKSKNKGKREKQNVVPIKEHPKEASSYSKAS
ncbi:hypothetical protein C7K38_06960 [Tetragenococcus osmophilus]|uniref:Uncharacterized protein n=1 Tax=Tetragenococcus osmophilus TaxID=526944 RepID=A0AA37XLB5_9ENTE|nr:hypothetical protein [Tetragenococcus osmophilus]AYW48133.1 hypothetical protein C7K38_06960 [Tetragenococcus osmophilus]GMA72196.1 hypothetical protein GCM10025885_12450 [Tetragenococcus osmophilus]